MNKQCPHVTTSQEALRNRSSQDRNANCDRKKSGNGKKKDIAQDSPKGVVDMPKVAALQLSSHLFLISEGPDIFSNTSSD